jgi:F0F1-type ATP synthase assembly protein I
VLDFVKKNTNSLSGTLTDLTITVRLPAFAKASPSGVDDLRGCAVAGISGCEALRLGKLDGIRVVLARSQWNVTDQRPRPHPYAAAMEWVAKITTVGMEMVLPAVAGRYLDKYLQTRYWVVVGLVLGGALGFWHLMRMTRVVSNKQGPSNREGSDGGSAGE